jgi:hypothetical protein
MSESGGRRLGRDALGKTAKDYDGRSAGDRAHRADGIFGSATASRALVVHLDVVGV